LAAQLEERYFRQKVKLGQGSFGTVWRAVDRQSGENVAIKQLLKANFTKRGVSRADIEREMSLMKACNHRNITQLLGFFENDTSLFLALEYCDSGDFGDKIREQGLGITEAEAAAWVRQMCDAVCVLHTQGICHRDIKPENFMVHQRTNLKLSDFGLATGLQKGQLLQDVCGTRAFNAPEQHPIAVKNGGYGFPVDMWALGISVYLVMFGGRHPFMDENHHLDETLMLAGKLDFRDRSSATGFLGLEGPNGIGLRFSEAARRFCRRLADPDQVRRIQAWEAVYEPWLKSGGGRIEEAEEPSSCITSTRSERRSSSKGMLPPPCCSRAADRAKSMQLARILAVPTPLRRNGGPGPGEVRL